MEKSWNFDFEFLWELCLNGVHTIGDYRFALHLSGQTPGTLWGYVICLVRLG